MWFFTRILLFSALLILAQIYYLKRGKKIYVYFFGSEKLKFYKIVRNVFIIAVNAYPIALILFFIYRYFNPGRFSTNIENTFFDIFLLFPFWISALTIIQSILFFLLTDLLKGIFYLLFKYFRNKLRKIHTYVSAAILVVFIIYVPARIAYDYFAVDVTKVIYKKDNLNSDLENLKIVLISDLQADRYTTASRLGNYIEMVNELKPDIILIAGDLITGSPDYINVSAEITGKLEAPLGVYACIGDHDNWAYRSDPSRSLSELSHAFKKVNIPIFNNDTLIVKKGNGSIGISFITNTYNGFIGQKKLDELAAANSNVDLRIFLTHQVRDFLINAAAKYKNDMYFAGHTHGGQITVLFPFFNLSPTLMETNKVKGSFYLNTMLIQVCGGMGVSLAPVRFNSTPEIVEIIVKNN